MKITIEIDEDDPRFKKLINFLDKLGGIETSHADDDKEQENEDEGSKDSVNDIDDDLLKQTVTVMHDTEQRILTSFTGPASANRPPAWWDASGTTIIAKHPDGLVSIGTFNGNTLTFSVFLSTGERPYTPLLGVTGYGITLWNAFTEFKSRFQNKLKGRSK